MRRVRRVIKRVQFAWMALQVQVEARHELEVQTQEQRAKAVTR